MWGHWFSSSAARARSCSNSAAGSTAGRGAGTCHQWNTNDGQPNRQSSIFSLKYKCYVQCRVSHGFKYVLSSELKQKHNDSLCSVRTAAFFPDSSTSIGTWSPFQAVVLLTETCSSAAFASGSRRLTLSAPNPICGHSFPCTQLIQAIAPIPRQDPKQAAQLLANNATPVMRKPKCHLAAPYVVCPSWKHGLWPVKKEIL